MTKLYVEVLNKGREGFWEIDLDTKVALFRDWEHKREGDPLKEGMLHDWHEFHNTISDFLKEKMDALYVKEIIPDTKFIYSNDTPFCVHSHNNVISWNPNAVKHCTRPATVVVNGEPRCNEHGHVNF